MTERRENCPGCGEGNFKFWLYDSQTCTVCDHGRENVKLRKMKRTPEMEAMLAAAKQEDTPQ